MPPSAGPTEQQVWLRAPEAAAHLRMSRGTFDHLVREGKIPAHRFTERVVRFDLRELDEWARSQDATRGQQPAPRGERGRFAGGR